MPEAMKIFCVVLQQLYYLSFYLGLQSTWKIYCSLFSIWVSSRSKIIYWKTVFFPHGTAMYLCHTYHGCICMGLILGSIICSMGLFVHRSVSGLYSVSFFLSHLVLTQYCFNYSNIIMSLKIDVSPPALFFAFRILELAIQLMGFW